MMLPVFARDFNYTYEGQTITYTVIDEQAKTVKTKSGKEYKHNESMIPGNKVSGDLILPAHPKDGEVECALSAIGDSGCSACLGPAGRAGGIPHPGRSR